MLRKNRMMRDPGAVFKDPLRVLEHPDLTPAQKTARLKPWKDEIIPSTGYGGREHE